MTRLYHYVGPEEIRARVALIGTAITSLADLRAWVTTNDADAEEGVVPATYTVVADGTGPGEGK